MQIATFDGQSWELQGDSLRRNARKQEAAGEGLPASEVSVFVVMMVVVVVVAINDDDVVMMVMIVVVVMMMVMNVNAAHADRRLLGDLHRLGGRCSALRASQRLHRV